MRLYLLKKEPKPIGICKNQEIREKKLLPRLLALMMVVVCCGWPVYAEGFKIGDGFKATAKTVALVSVERDEPTTATKREKTKRGFAQKISPAVTALAKSPDGKYLAIGRMYDLIVWESNTAEADVTAGSLPSVKRLSRFTSKLQFVDQLAWSPDGKYLASCGGTPGETGLVEIWDLSTNQLHARWQVSEDTVFGLAWSPDGKHLAYGDTENELHLIRVADGTNVFTQKAHSDWVLTTLFSSDGKSLVSGCRDGSLKLVDIETSQFIDDITSVSGGLKRGKLCTVAKHPHKEQVVLAGTSGVLRAYRVHRLFERVVGDDGNLLREYARVAGTIRATCYSGNGNHLGVVSNQGEASFFDLFASPVVMTPPAEVQAVQKKNMKDRSSADTFRLTLYHQQQNESLRRVKIPASNVFSVELFYLQGTEYGVVGTEEGAIYLVSLTDRNVTKATKSSLSKLSNERQSLKKLGASGTLKICTKISLPQVTLTPDLLEAEFSEEVSWSTELESHDAFQNKPSKVPPFLAKQLAQSPIEKLEVSPTEVLFTNPYQRTQLVVSGRLKNGQRVDLTPYVSLGWKNGPKNVPKDAPQKIAQSVLQNLITWDASYYFTPRLNGQSELLLSFGKHQLKLPVSVAGAQEQPAIDFHLDVMPVLTQLGCNMGSCHGSKNGKYGFKLSLRGYDTDADYLALRKELMGRRILKAIPSQSLFLKKTAGELEHAGGICAEPGSREYETLSHWIRQGGSRVSRTVTLRRLEILPQHPVLANKKMTQQLRAVAYYSDGTTRDVTRESDLKVVNLETFSISSSGRLTSLRRGESPITARYQGAHAVTTAVTIGPREGFRWQQLITHNRIDKLVDAKLKRLKTQPSGLCTDLEFLRRIYLDLTGHLPTPQEAKLFIADPRDSQKKRNHLIDRLIGSPRYNQHRAMRWADLLMVNRDYLGDAGVTQFEKWLTDSIAKNEPYDQFVRKIITASGSNQKNPAASYYKIHRSPEALVESTTQLFLGVRFNCNKCHDHLFEHWTQDQYYELASFFSEVARKDATLENGKKLVGSVARASLPLYEIISDAKPNVVINIRTGEGATARFPYTLSANSTADQTASLSKHPRPLRAKLATWLTSEKNNYFVKNYVNRLWGDLLGRGLIEPLDDVRSDNPPTNKPLMRYLMKEFVESRFNRNHLVQLICRSRTYQASWRTNPFNQDDLENYSHRIPQRHSARTLSNMIYQATGSAPKKTASGFLRKLGGSSRESVCECDANKELSFGPIMSLLNGTVLSEALSDPENKISELEKKHSDNTTLVTELYWNILSRPPSSEELVLAKNYLKSPVTDHQELLTRLAKRESELQQGFKTWLQEFPIIRWDELALAEALVQPPYAKEEDSPNQIHKIRVSLSRNTKINAEVIRGLKLSFSFDPIKTENVSSKELILYSISIKQKDAKSGKLVPFPLRRITFSGTLSKTELVKLLEEDQNTKVKLPLDTTQKCELAISFLKPFKAAAKTEHLFIEIRSHNQPRPLKETKIYITKDRGPYRFGHARYQPEILELLSQYRSDKLSVQDTASERMSRLREAYLNKKEGYRQLLKATKLAENSRLYLVQDLVWSIMCTEEHMFQR